MDLSLEDINNEVLRKIGRNLMLYQRIESMLKYLLASSGQISGYISDFPTLKEQQVKAIQKQTMGQLTRNFLATIASQIEHINTEIENPKDIWIDISLTFQSTDNIDDIQRMLASTVAERNKLAHHFLSMWDMTSPVSGKEAEHYLDQQHSEIRQSVLYLKNRVRVMSEAKKFFAEYFSSQAFQEEWELSFKYSRIITLLSEIAMQKKRSDGWVDLAVAGYIIQQQASEDITVLKEQYGYKTLKALLVATNTFDIHEEVMSKGGVRVLYRLKTE